MRVGGNGGDNVEHPVLSLFHSLDSATSCQVLGEGSVQDHKIHCITAGQGNIQCPGGNSIHAWSPGRLARPPQKGRGALSQR